MKNSTLILFTLLIMGCNETKDEPKGEPQSTHTELESGTTNNTPTPTPTPLIKSSFKINLKKVPHYSANDSIQKQYLSIVNYLRSLPVKCNDTHGLAGPVTNQLKWNRKLEEVAKEHSEDMLAINVMSHSGSGRATDLTGQDFTPSRASSSGERVLFNDYNYRTFGENVSYRAQYPTLDQQAWVDAMERWMKSKTGHCSNIMSPKFNDFGMVEARGTQELTLSDGLVHSVPAAYWTQVFGTAK